MNAADFAHEWIDAWNAHDLERILSHYRDDFEMSSPYIARITGEPSGTLRGKAAVGAYWKKGLERMPELHFELLSTHVGVNSIALYYKAVGGRLAVEVMTLDENGKVSRAHAHYA